MHPSIENRGTVICVCGSEGFPYGFGGTARITLVGKALQAASLKFHILHCGPSPLAENIERRGVHEGLSFEYTSSVAWPKNRLTRRLAYARALMGLALKLVRARMTQEHIAVYLYAMHGLLNLIVGALCHWLSVPLVQEMCEWWPAEPRCSALTRWLFRERMFRVSSGLLVISTAIERWAHERAAKINPCLAVYRLPSVVDLDRFTVALPPASPTKNLVPNFVWCGTLDGWLADVMFLLAAIGRVRMTHSCRLTLIGKYSDPAARAVKQRASEYGLSVAEGHSRSANGDGQLFEDVCLMGWVDEATFLTCLRDATALLLPLWHDDRSRTRMPNKLGEYLASGKPVIVGRVGDLVDFLADGINACLAEPGDVTDFADKMLAILKNPRMASRIGAAGRKICEQRFDYRAHAKDLARFFEDCLQQSEQLPMEVSST